MSLGHRIYVRKKYIDIYRELRADKPSSPRVFTENKDLFILCCTVGFKFEKKNELKNTEMLLWSGTFDQHQDTVLKAIAVKSTNEQNLSILDDPESVYRISEQYADKGMEILIEEIFEPYIKEQEDGTLTIVYNEKADLLKGIIHYVDSLNEEINPFD
jgi:dnd system-associated protein 4